MERPSPPANILFFSSFENLGQGGQESLFLLASQLNRDCFHSVVLVPKWGSLANELGKASIDTVVLDLPPLRPAGISHVVRAVYKLWGVAKRYQIDLLHSDGPRNMFYAGVVGKLRQRPVLWHVRSSESDPHDRLLCFLSTRLLLVADALAFRFPRESEKAKCVTIHNGVDLLKFTPQLETNLEPTSGSLERPGLSIAQIGRVEPQKGQRYLVEACGRLRDRLPYLRVIFAGEITDRTYAEHCLLRAHELGISERIRFIEHQADIRGLLRASDIFVLPSIRGEAFSRAILEAMAMAKPVIATTCGGSTEAFVDHESGFAVPPEDSSALAEKIALLAGDPKLRCRIGQAARRRVETLFGIEANIARTVQVYAEVLRHRS